MAIEPRGYIAEGQNPFAKIKQRRTTEKPLRYVTIEEYRNLINAAGNLWWKAAISIAYGSGIRRNEILNMTWKDIDFEKHLIKIVAKKETEYTIEWEPKDHENRVVPMTEETEQLLTKLQIEAPEGYPYVFVSPLRLQRIKERKGRGNWGAKPEIINNLIRDFDVFRQKISVKKCTLHDLRRSAITNWAQRLPIQVVQLLAGHSDITTTKKYYITVRPEDLALANEVLSSMLSGRSDKLTPN